jgi:hypothetical protein
MNKERYYVVQIAVDLSEIDVQYDSENDVTSIKGVFSFLNFFYLS